MNILENKVALVTGASRGIGRATAAALAKEGAHVVLVARSKDRLTSAIREFATLGLKASIEVADITDSPQLDRVINSTQSRFGRLDILVNNAGIGHFKPLNEMPLREFDEMWNLNMRAVVCGNKSRPSIHD